MTCDASAPVMDTGHSHTLRLDGWRDAQAGTVVVPPQETSMQEPSVLEAVLERDRLIVVLGLVTVIVLAWLYIALGAGMDLSACAMPPRWTPTYAGLMVVMWWVMMVAMMVPSAAPMILLFARIQRSQQAKGAPFVPTSVFAGGYLTTWGAFSVLAAGTQWGLERVGLLSATMASTSGLAGGILLLTAGFYQLTPLKHACLTHCRSPLSFLTHYWRNGIAGALRMGVRHGAFCLGCCWLLMSLLFVGGVMNLYWIVGLAVFVLLEKTIPAGHWLGSITGMGLMAWGGWLLAGTLL